MCSTSSDPESIRVPGMKQLGTMIRNTSYLALAETVKPALSFILILVISRVLGRDGVGSYTIILTFTGLFELIATVGLGPLIVRGIAADRSQLSFYASGAVGVALLASAILLPLMLLILRAMNYPAEIALGIRLLACTLLLAILQQYLLSTCEGLQKMRLRAALSVADTAGRLITGVFMVMQGYGVMGIIEGMVLVRAITTVVASVVVVRRTGLSLDYRVMLRSSVGLARAAVPFLLMTIASTVFWSINTLMLSKLSRVEDVGTYNAASRITDVTKTFLFSYQIVLLPIMSASFVRSREQFRQQCNASIKYLALLSVPMATGISVLAPRIVPLVFGQNFAPAIQVLQVLAWTVCIFSIALVFARVLIASHNQVLDLYCNVAALGINIVLGWILIHSYGPSGAAIATLVSLTAFGVLEYCFVASKLFKAEVLVPLARAAGASAVMGFAVVHLNRLPLLVAIIVGSLVYLTALICIGTFSLTEIRAAGDLIARRTSALSSQWAERAPVKILPQPSECTDERSSGPGA
jgi:O-antigen/teichoic acid export membrane protein